MWCTSNWFTRFQLKDPEGLQFPGPMLLVILHLLKHLNSIKGGFPVALPWNIFWGISLQITISVFPCCSEFGELQNSACGGDSAPRTSVSSDKVNLWMKIGVYLNWMWFMRILLLLLFFNGIFSKLTFWIS